MDAADDESNPFARSTLSWRNGYLYLLIAVGGAYGVLLLAGRWSPSLAGLLPWPAFGMNEQLKLPLFAQLASLFAGLAALVLVLSRAVQEVDRRPYLAIAPVLAVFAGLVHAGLRVDLSASGMSGAQVAFGALAVALLGGALITRKGARPQLLGWTLVFVPSAMVLLAMTLTREPPVTLAPAERGYLIGLFASTLLLGIAGAAARRHQSRATLFSRSGFETHADPSPSFAHLPAAHLPAPGFYQNESFSNFLQAEAEEPAPYGDAYEEEYPGRKSGRLGAFLQTTIMLGAVAVSAYFAVDLWRHRPRAAPSEATPAPTAALTAPVGPPVVEQLGATGNTREGARAAAVPHRSEHSDRARSQKTRSSQTDDAAIAKAPAPAKAEAPAPVLSRKAVRAQAKAARVAARREANSQKQASQKLPAWGAETVREFAATPAKPDKRSATKARDDDAIPASKPTTSTSKPTSVSPEKAPLAAKPIASPSKSMPSAPPPAPATPPPPSKPMTLNQLLNKVDDAAHEQRSKKGSASAPKSQADSELDDLINQAVHSKGK